MADTRNCAVCGHALCTCNAEAGAAATGDFTLLRAHDQFEFGVHLSQLDEFTDVPFVPVPMEAIEDDALPCGEKRFSFWGCVARTLIFSVSLSVSVDEPEDEMDVVQPEVDLQDWHYRSLFLFEAKHNPSRRLMDDMLS